MYQNKHTIMSCPFTVHFYRERFLYSSFNFYITQAEHHSEISGPKSLSHTNPWYFITKAWQLAMNSLILE